MKRHRKKKVAAITVAGVLATMLGFWSDVYPVVCKRVRDPELCEAVSKAAIGNLDTMKLDNGATDAGQ